MKRLKKKYKAMGFVEALIAIMVTGIASVVLMDIAARTMKAAIQNEAIDQMTQYAVETSERVKEIFKEDPSIVISNDECRTVREDSDDEDNDGNTNDWILNSVENDRDIYKETGAISDTGYFRVVCADSIASGGYQVLNIIVGKTNTAGLATSGNDIKDYNYITIVKTE